MLFGFFLLVVMMWGINSLARLLKNPVFPAIGLGGMAGSATTNNGLATIDFSFFPSIRKNYISQGYGATSFSSNYLTPWHNGIDIVASPGTPIESATDGKILVVGNQDEFCPGRGYGRFVVVRANKDQKVLLYAHLSEIKVQAAEEVRRGTVVGLVGMTGFATAPHLHFAVFERGTFYMKNQEGCGLTPSGKDMNPISYLNSLHS